MKQILKIATHDSATGESGAGILSFLLSPFAKTQSKSIYEQYEAGCRSFDIRVRRINGEWHCAHGPWRTRRTAQQILNEINHFQDKCEVCVTFEGNDSDLVNFINFIHEVRETYKRIVFGPFCIKYGKDSTRIKVKYETINEGDKEYSGGTQGFLPLDGRSWHTYIPIPWLWNLIYTRKKSFNDKTFTFVDFL